MPADSSNQVNERIRLQGEESAARHAKARKPGQTFVGFALEPREQLMASARSKLDRKSLDMIVANHAPSAIGADDNEVTILDAAGETALPRMPKEHVSTRIVEHALSLLEKRNPRRSD